MLSIWDHYPDNYRMQEVAYICQTVMSGGCVSILGLSGSGKSNLMGYIAARISLPDPSSQFFLVDCNRLIDPSPGAFYRMIGSIVSGERLEYEALQSHQYELVNLDRVLAESFKRNDRISLLLDRFDVIAGLPDFNVVAGNLRSLRDAWKYRLTYVTATRRPFDVRTELTELFLGHELWLGSLSHEDALWSARQDATRFSEIGKTWDLGTLEKLVEFSWGYPSMLRGCSEAYAAGCMLTIDALLTHPAVRRRVNEFWIDEPTVQMLEESGIHGHPLLFAGRPSDSRQPFKIDTSGLTAKESLLLEFMVAHEGEVVEKDELVRAVWPEDVIFERGIRDDSLAQLVRRLRKKIEPDPGDPQLIHTIPGRGYLFRR